MDVPVRPLAGTIRQITTKHFQKAGIVVGERKRGPHALRSTLASELVMEKIPYDAVRRILGHENPAVINEYVNFDIESLRSCALPVPNLSGKIEKFMS
jgi:integrase